jgi:large subunit ribosomal protein L7e
MASNNEELQLVPEAILKRKHDMDDMRAHRAAQQIINPRGNRKIFSQKTKVIKIHKPETILAMARSKRNHSIRYNRVLRKGMQKRASKSKLEKTKIVVPDGVTNAEEEEELQREVSFVSNSVGAKMVFVVRIREPNGMPKKVKKILNGMKLKSSNEVCCCFMFIIGDRSCKLWIRASNIRYLSFQGIFLRYDETTKKQLHLVEPWVTYGVPSKVVINDLLRRRGHGKLDGKRIPLSDNTIVEQALGESSEGSVICIDDMVHELYSVGDQFKIVNNFLWAFQLSSVRSKFRREKLNFKDGGDYGDRGEEMDDLIRQML